MYNDADIEMAELTAISNQMTSVTDDTNGARLLHPATRARLVIEVAVAAWFGSSVVQALADALADEKLVVTNDYFDGVLAAGVQMHDHWEEFGGGPTQP